MIVGHQLCAALGVLLAHGSSRHAAAVIEMTRDLWRRRRTDEHRPQIVDTHYDTGSLLNGRFRCLVDVCTEVGLDVTRPELVGTSMSALHRRWLETKDMRDRERITVMNLRHSLSAALVALRAVGWGTWTPTLNVNDLLDRELGGSFAWIETRPSVPWSPADPMSIGSCRVVAVEGSHAAGKTTLVHALVARYRAHGALVTCTGEPARTSPFIEDIVRRDRGEFDLDCEVDLFAAQLTEQLRAARHHDLLVCDKTVMNVLADARLVLDTSDERIAGVLDAIECFCTAWAPGIYDLVVHCADTYDQPNDTL